MSLPFGHADTTFESFLGQWFGQFSGRDSLNDAVITKGFILGAIFPQGLAMG